MRTNPGEVLTSELQRSSMSKGFARISKKGCGGPAAGRAVRIDEHFFFERLLDVTDTARTKTLRPRHHVEED